MSEDNQIRVRFAPSPTGMLHIGGARTAIDNWAYARAQGGKFILRIEDTDPERSTEQNSQIILRALKWLGLDWDEGPEVEGPVGPYFQMQRLQTYKEALQTLIDNDAAYPCFCTKEEIDAKRQKAQKEEGGYNGYDRTCRNIPKEEAEAKIQAGIPHVWRLKVPDNHKPIEFDDAVYGHMSFPADVMDDLVLTRGDGIPTYNFAVVCDDSSMGITHVIRGDDHLSNTPRQILIYELLGRNIPTFAHLSMILGPDGKKLSKRHGSTSVEEYQARGYLPEALINFLALLGWSLDDKTTIIPPDVLCKNFSLDRVNRKDCIFDETKLNWMNGCYIREMGAKELAKRSRTWLAKSVALGNYQMEKYAGLIVPTPPKNAESEPLPEFSENTMKTCLQYVDEHPQDMVDACQLIIERIDRLDQIPEKLSFLFWGSNIMMDEKSLNKVLLKQNSRADEALEALKKVIETQEWNVDVLQNSAQELTAKLDMKPRLLFQPLRVAVCGNMVSPPLFESIVLMKRKDVVERINKTLALMN